MRKRKLLFAVLVVSLVMMIPTITHADGEPMGSFKVNIPKSIEVKSNEYVPIDEVASTLELDCEWRYREGKVRGSFGHSNFSSDRFIIADGHLYLPIEIITDIFGLVIENRGNKYFIYRLYQPFYGVDLVLRTNKTRVDRHEPIAVSILLINETDRTIDLRYTSGKKYDLILKRHGREFWRLNEDRGFVSVIRSETLTSGDYLLFTELIQPSADNYMYRGEYELVAEIETTDGRIISNTVPLTLE